MFVIHKVGTDNEEVEQLFREKLVNVSGIVDLAYDWLDERLYYVLHTPQGQFHHRLFLIWLFLVLLRFISYNLTVLIL